MEKFDRGSWSNYITPSQYQCIRDREYVEFDLQEEGKPIREVKLVSSAGMCRICVARFRQEGISRSMARRMAGSDYILTASLTFSNLPVPQRIRKLRSHVPFTACIPCLQKLDRKILDETTKIAE